MQNPSECQNCEVATLHMNFEVCDSTIYTLKPKIEIFMAVDGSKAPGRILSAIIRNYFLKTGSQCTEIDKLTIF
jgi:hypothetical protein